MPGCKPEGAGQSEVPRRRGNRDGGGPIFDQRRDFLGRAEIGLVDNPRLAIDAGAFDDIVIKLVAFFLGDERSHTG